jgi:hypothetical protein
MKKDWRYIALLAVAVGFTVLVRMLAPREFNWTVTFHPDDKNPFGGYVVNEMMGDMFKRGDIHQSNYTLYELLDSTKKPVNVISFSTDFTPGSEDKIALLKNVEKGADAFIAADEFSEDFLDTLQAKVTDYFIDNTFDALVNREDTSTVTFKNPHLSSDEYFYPRKNIHNYFNHFDTAKTTVIAINDLKLPVLIRMQWGKGNLYLCTLPLAFSNAYLLMDQNYQFAEQTLSYLPEEPIEWTQYYQLGRREIQSPLRFVLTNESLAWAYYITIGALLLFMIFEMKRRQRIIPVIKPLENTSLQFVSTIGNLYYQNGDHKNIIEKKVNYLLERIRTRFYMQTHVIDDSFITTLARKSGHPESDVRALFSLIRTLQQKPQVMSHELIELNLKIEKFTF